jgi:hypothetical protein
MRIPTVLFISVCFTGITLFGANDAGSTSTSFDAAIKASVDPGIDPVISFSSDVLLTEQVRPLNSDGDFSFAGDFITLEGNDFTLNGNEQVRCLAIGGAQTASVQNTPSNTELRKVRFEGGKAKAGDSASREGGGGMGAGGALYVTTAAVVVLEECTFNNCNATGGSVPDGTIPSGGGGMTGKATEGGGGGFGGNGAEAGGGASGFSIGNASGTTPGNSFDGGGSAGDPGVGGSPASKDGGYGGGGSKKIGEKAGRGGHGGGGGYADVSGDGGEGGFGGGGGGSKAGAGGKGGFGGGGAGGTANPPGAGGFGGGNGTNDGSGVGGAFGGAIFMETESEVTLKKSASFSNNTVQIGGGAKGKTQGAKAMGKDIFMMSQSQLNVDIDTDLMIPNPIEGNQGDQTPDGPSGTGSGGLMKMGPAMLTLVGDNTFTGTTTVETGQLRVFNGSLVTNVVVQTGGILDGNFFVKKDATGNNGGNLTNNGIFSPGVNGVGNVGIEMDFTQTASGTFLLDITPSGNGSDKLFATSGVSNLDGILKVVANPGNYIGGTTYQAILGPSNGQFANIIGVGFNGINLALNVDYNVDGAGVLVTLLNSILFQHQQIDSGIPQEVVCCIKSAPIVPHSDFATVVEALGTLSNKEVNEALISLSPVQFGSLEWINARNNSLVTGILAQHLFELCCSPRDCCSCDCNTSFWVAGYANFMDNHRRCDQLSPFDATAGGIVTGIDWCCNPCLYFGGAVGYTHTGFDWDKHGGCGQINSYYGALYSSWHLSCLTLDASVLGGGSSHDIDRKIDFANIYRTAKSDPWGYFFTGHLGARTDWSCFCITVEPFALVDYHYFHRESFHEKGAKSINLDVKEHNEHSLRGEAGLFLFSPWMCQSGCIAPYLGLSWVGEFPLNDSDQVAHFQGQKCKIDTEAYDSSVQLASPEVGVKWTSCGGFSALIGYKGLYNSDVRISQIEGRLEWIF